uniref:Serine carboxypeptidase n=1 Tax=Solanum tuberosum TaxID=4113 RepID=M1ARY2_SOLTU
MTLYCRWEDGQRCMMDLHLQQLEELAMKFHYFNLKEHLSFSNHSWLAKNYQNKFRKFN